MNGRVYNLQDARKAVQDNPGVSAADLLALRGDKWDAEATAYLQSLIKPSEQPKIATERESTAEERAFAEAQPVASVPPEPVPVAQQQAEAAAVASKDAPGTFPHGKFATICIPLIERGIPMTPVRPGKKNAFLPDFPTTATTDWNQVLVWDQQFPGHNAACVARAEDGGVWFWEVDSPDVLARIQKDTGHDALVELQTFKVRSRPGRGHFYFRHTPSTLTLPNISQSYVIGQDWSVRTNREYVVAPGSIHPDTGEPYEAKDWSMPIATAPDWLIDWLLSQKVQKQSGEKAEAPRNESNRVPHGAIHGWMLTQAGKLRDNGLNQDELEPILLRLVHENCEPPIDDSKVVAMAKSICNYAAGSNWTLILNQQQGVDSSQPSEPTDAFRFTDVNLKPTAGSTLLVFESLEDAKFAERLGFNATAVLPGEGSSSVSATVTSIKLTYERLVLFGNGEAIKALKVMVTPGSIFGEFPDGYESLDGVDGASLLSSDDELRDHLNKQLKRPELQKTSVMLDEGVYRERVRNVLTSALWNLNGVEDHDTRIVYPQDPRIVVQTSLDRLKNLQLNHSGHPQPLTSVSLHGLIGDYVELCYPTTAACRELLHANILPVLGAMFGRVMPCFFGSDIHPGADFFLVIARTADGKGQAISHAGAAAKAIDPVWAGEHYYTQAASGEGVVRILADKGLANRGVRAALVVPEMTECLTSQARDGSTLGEKIREAWDCIKLDNQRSDFKRSKSAQNYTLGICGAITPQALEDALPKIDWANGSVNRFNWCVPSETKAISRSQGKPNLAEWVQRAQALYKLNQEMTEPREIAYSTAGAKVWDEWVDSLPVYDDGDLMADGMARTKPHAFRLANLYAQLDERRLTGWVPQLEPVHVQAAIEIVERSRQSMQWYLDRGKDKMAGVDKGDIITLRQMLAKKVAETQEARLTGTEVCKAFSHLTEEQRNMLCIEAGLVPKRHGGVTGGRPAMAWVMRGSE